MSGEMRLCLLFISFAFPIGFLTAQEASSEGDWRLPQGLNPIYYELLLDLGQGETQKGFTAGFALDFVASRDTPRLVLNAVDLSFNYSTLSLADEWGKPLPIPKVQEDPTLQRIVFQADSPFRKGSRYNIKVLYQGLIYEDEGFGLYKNKYLDNGDISREFFVTQLRPVHARRLFPCFDEPHFRAAIQLTVKHHPSQYALSSMPVASVTSISGGRLMTRFDPTPRIPAFLLALMVGDLPSLRNGDFASYAVPNKIESAKYAAQIGPSLAAAMTSHLGIPYSLNKTDILALPFLVPVAMENWGLYTFREAFSLYTEGVSKTIQKQTVARFVGHEVTHAWMGNPVTLKWWDYLWLSEVFAMYYEYYLPGKVEPTWKMNDQLVVDLHQQGLDSDSEPNNPLTTTVLTPSQISAKFSGLTYSKGPALLRMVIHILNENYYIKSFSRFLKRNAYSSVEPDDLWNALDKDTLPVPLSEIMRNWTMESGYPVIDIIRNEKGKFVLTQSTFTKTPSKSPDNKRWWIPLSYTTSYEKDFENTQPKAWFPPKSQVSVDIPLKLDDWVIFNIQSTGFYRVNYDLENWDSLMKQLYRNHGVVASVNRAQLLDDSLNLAKTGRLPYKVALDLACYLTNERNYVPWASAFNALSFLDSALLYSSLHSKFLEYVGALVQGPYEELGFDGRRGEPHLAKMLKELIVQWACKAGNKFCIQRSLRYVASLAPGKLTERLSPDVKETALCTGVAAGKQAEWELVLSLYNKATLLEEKSRLLAGLACSTNPDNIQGFLADHFNKDMKESDWATLFSAMAGQKENAEHLLDFLVANQDSIISRFDTSNLEKYLNELLPSLTNKQHLGKLKKLELASGIDLSNGKDDVTRRLEWFEKYCIQLKEYFEELMNVKTKVK